MEKLKDYHFRMSLIKSIVRIIGFTAILFNITVGVLVLILAEIIGIVEEL